MMRMAWVAVLGAAGLVSVTACRPDLQQSPSIRSEPMLDARIGAARPSQYRAVREARDWRNPYLDASNDGFRLRSLSSPEPKSVSLADLRRVLTELPSGDWPYGRVVVVQPPSIVPSDEGWIAAMTRNVAAAKIIMAALGVDWWAWPP
jgi:hypothetical protein